MKKFLKACVVASIVAGSAIVGFTGTAWASPCASGEKIVGQTSGAWLCQNIKSGAIRTVDK